jgi:hypothetical protein
METVPVNMGAGGLIPKCLAGSLQNVFCINLNVRDGMWAT